MDGIDFFVKAASGIPELLFLFGSSFFDRINMITGMK